MESLPGLNFSLRLPIQSGRLHKGYNSYFGMKPYRICFLRQWFSRQPDDSLLLVDELKDIPPPIRKYAIVLRNSLVTYVLIITKK